MTATELRHDWTLQEARELFELPFNDLLFRAQSVHRHETQSLHLLIHVFTPS